MYDTILYPTDGSTGSETAARHVRELASAFDAAVHVLYVVDTTHLGAGMAGAFLADEGSGLSGEGVEGSERGMVGDRSDVEERRAVLSDRAEEVVEEAASALGDVETVTAVEHGTPHSAILKYADENGADLVVMGTHGRTGVERYLLGSVAEKVVRLADPPVVTVRADEGD
ncbi:universal stress protein [Halorubrum salipaludis]|uniref:Universal stress protein n=1 Tax=Halorubrum salipaludis TaxID=2032630 RepID=A0A2A2FI49_9EURY|nr:MULTISPECIES: universal stress protein [Halorubrum]PAU84225.1 universal stress protein [Halorubrum salipaludis]